MSNAQENAQDDAQASAKDHASPPPPAALSETRIERVDFMTGETTEVSKKISTASKVSGATFLSMVLFYLVGKALIHGRFDWRPVGKDTALVVYLIGGIVLIVAGCFWIYQKGTSNRQLPFSMKLLIKNGKWPLISALALACFAGILFLTH